MSEANDGRPAFPTIAENYGFGVSPGMSLRHYFAAAALTGLLANLNVNREANFATLATYCYGAADAMVAKAAKDKE